MHFSGKLYFYAVALIPMLQRKCNSEKLQARKKSKLFSRMYLLRDNVQTGSLEASASCWRRGVCPGRPGVLTPGADPVPGPAGGASTPLPGAGGVASC